MTSILVITQLLSFEETFAASLTTLGWPVTSKNVQIEPKSIIAHESTEIAMSVSSDFEIFGD